MYILFDPTDSSDSKPPDSFSNATLILKSTIGEAESINLPPLSLSTASSNNKSPDPVPEIVPVSNSTWISVLPDSGAKPPLTIDTSASAVPELKVNSSPSS